MAEEAKQALISRIDNLKTRITNRYNTLNIEAIWLFVATLGCWSVDQPYVQIIAIIIVLVLFASRVSKEHKFGSTFGEDLKKIRIEIENSPLEGDTKKARLYELDEINKNLLSLKSMHKYTPMFLLGYGFWAVSFIVFLYRTLGILFFI